MYVNTITCPFLMGQLLLVFIFFPFLSFLSLSLCVCVCVVFAQYYIHIMTFLHLFSILICFFFSFVFSSLHARARTQYCRMYQRRVYIYVMDKAFGDCLYVHSIDRFNISIILEQCIGDSIAW